MIKRLALSVTGKVAKPGFKRKLIANSGIFRMFGVMNSSIYPMEKFRADFGPLCTELDAIAEQMRDKPDDLLNREQVEIISCMSMVLNFRRFTAREKHNRSARREALTEDNMTEYEKLILQQIDILEFGLNESMKSVTESIDLGHQRFLDSFNSFKSSDPKFQKEMDMFWQTATRVASEPPVPNKKGLTDEQIIEAFDYASDAAKTFTTGGLPAKVTPIMKPVYINDIVALKYGFEPGEVLMEFGSASDSVKDAYMRFMDHMALDGSSK